MKLGCIVNAKLKTTVGKINHIIIFKSGQKQI